MRDGGGSPGWLPAAECGGKARITSRERRGGDRSSNSGSSDSGGGRGDSVEDSSTAGREEDAVAFADGGMRLGEGKRNLV